MASGSIQENVERVRERIAAACRRVGRRPQEVRLIAVSKMVPPERIREAYEAGVRDFGENRLQEADAKRPFLADLSITWHLVGHLQTNKARRARKLFQWIHSLDSLRLAEKLEELAGPDTIPLPVLLEVNLGEEKTKSGVSEADVPQLAEQVGKLPHLRVRGLMAIPPLFAEVERVRPYFCRLRELAQVLVAAHLPNVSMDELSMGMSHDFEVAIEEGATMVRVGTAIFGPRGL